MFIPRLSTCGVGFRRVVLPHLCGALVAAWLVLGAQPARAQLYPLSDAPALPPAAASAAAGMFLPYTQAPRTDSQRGFVRAIGGYDFARNSSQLEAAADVTLFGPVAVRAGAVYTQRPNNLRPTVGARVTALRQDAAGLDLSLGAYYRPEGFTEAEGEVEFVVAMARSFGRFTTFANLIYGQDPEGAERDGELRLAALYACNDVLHAGIDGRLRFDMGSDAGKRRAPGEAGYDLALGPTLSHSFGNVAAIGQLGVSAFGAPSTRFGWLALFGFAGSI